MYNDELKILFMTSNLIGGFIQRTEGNAYSETIVLSWSVPPSPALPFPLMNIDIMLFAFCCALRTVLHCTALYLYCTEIRKWLFGTMTIRGVEGAEVR